MSIDTHLNDQMILITQPYCESRQIGGNCDKHVARR